MNDDAPTLGEAVRRLDVLVSEIRDMRREIGEDRARFEARFLPRAEFDLSQAADAIQMRGLEGEVHSVAKRLDVVESGSKEQIKDVGQRIDTIEAGRRTERMWVIGAVVVPLLLFVLNALLIARAL